MGACTSGAKDAKLRAAPPEAAANTDQLELTAIAVQGPGAFLLGSQWLCACVTVIVPAKNCAGLCQCGRSRGIDSVHRPMDTLARQLFTSLPLHLSAAAHCHCPSSPLLTATALRRRCSLPLHLSIDSLQRDCRICRRVTAVSTDA